MRSDHAEIVCFALAFHLRVDSNLIDPSQRLDEDLGLDPLDLVLVVLRLEELGDIEFPVAALEGLRTVADLVEVVRAWCSDPETLPLERSTASPPPVRTESGFRLSVPREEAEARSEAASRRAG